MWVVKLIPLDPPATGGFIFINGVEGVGKDRMREGTDNV
jgi:hypothetical protein